MKSDSDSTNVDKLLTYYFGCMGLYFDSNFMDFCTCINGFLLFIMMKVSVFSVFHALHFAPTLLCLHLYHNYWYFTKNCKSHYMFFLSCIYAACSFFKCVRIFLLLLLSLFYTFNSSFEIPCFSIWFAVLFLKC